MRIQNVTTPVGRRAMTLALVKRQLEAADTPADLTADKWKVFRDACEAREVLGIQDRALAVLNALLTFYPHSELAGENGLVVFPSNAQLSIRAHGITGTTLRRHLGALIKVGLIVRKDSPNGKRYARKDSNGRIERAFGFCLAPLLARSKELAIMAQKVAAERSLFYTRKEAVSIYRRDLRKLIAAGLEENAKGDWGTFQSRYRDLLDRIPRRPTLEDLNNIMRDMHMLYDEVVNTLASQLNTIKMDGNDVDSDCHLQNSKTQFLKESEDGNETRKEGNPSDSEPTRCSVKALPLTTVLRACPQISTYDPRRSISSWQDLMCAAIIARSALGVSPSAYQDACDVMGAENAAVVVACILERAGQINSAGAYLRNLTTRARRGMFSTMPMISALLRVNQDTHPE